MKVFAILLLLLLPVTGKSQMSELEYYKRLDSLSTKFIYYEIKKDSLDHVIINKFDTLQKERQKEIKRAKTKNIILGIAFTVAIIVISFIQ